MVGYDSPIMVVCQECGNRMSEEAVIILGIEEDVEGRDVLYFTCPYYGVDTYSLRYET